VTLRWRPVGDRLIATAHDDRREEQLVFVDQSGLDRLGREIGTAHADVMFRLRLHLPDRSRVEGALDARALARHRLQRRGVHDLVGRPPNIGEVLHHGRLTRGVQRLPKDHHLVHAATVEVGTDRPLQLVDERVHFFVGRGPLEVALIVGDVAVE
jgi:hypothetical protein